MINKTLHALFVAIAVFGLFFTACDKSNNPMVNNPTVDGPSLYDVNPPNGSFATDIIAGGGSPEGALDVGDIYVWFDADNMYIYYRTTEANWYLTEYHVQVGIAFDSLPHNNGGGIPGQFDQKGEIDLMDDEYLVTYPLTDAMQEADELYVAAHCCVEKWVGGSMIQEETGWGEGPEFGGGNWSMYFTVEVQKTLNLPTTAVYSRFIKISGGDIPALFDLENVPSGFDVDNATIYNSWCLDHGIYIYNQWYYGTHLWPSLGVDLPDYIEFTRHYPYPKTPYDKINYLLNEYLPPYEGYLPIAIEDPLLIQLQHCFWYYRGDLALTGLTEEEKDMVEDADANGGGFWPRKGQWMAVIIDNGTGVQITFLLLDP